MDEQAVAEEAENPSGVALLQWETEGEGSMYRRMDSAYGFVLIESGPLVLATTRWKGEDDVCCLSWTMALSFSSGKRNVALCTGPWNETYNFLKRTGQITLNIPVREMFSQAVSCGSLSFGECPDKFSKFGLKKLPGIENDCPVLDECAGFLECRLAKEYPEDRIVVLDTVDVGIDPERFVRSRIHAVGDGSFSFDGEIVDGRAHMGGKVPPLCQGEGYEKTVSFPKRSRRVG